MTEMLIDTVWQYYNLSHVELEILQLERCEFYLYVSENIHIWKIE